MENYERKGFRKSTIKIFKFIKNNSEKVLTKNDDGGIMIIVNELLQK